MAIRQSRADPFRTRDHQAARGNAELEEVTP